MRCRSGWWSRDRSSGRYPQVRYNAGEVKNGGGGGRHRNSRGGVGMESIRSRLGAGLG